MYNIWYGKRTGSNIGKPDKWNQFGPVEMAGGKFYVFDVTTANLGEADPQMINPMLSNPTDRRITGLAQAQHRVCLCESVLRARWEMACSSQVPGRCPDIRKDSMTGKRI